MSSTIFSFVMGAVYGQVEYELDLAKYYELCEKAHDKYLAKFLLITTGDLYNLLNQLFLDRDQLYTLNKHLENKINFLEDKIRDYMVDQANAFNDNAFINVSTTDLEELKDIKEEYKVNLDKISEMQTKIDVNRSEINKLCYKVYQEYKEKVELMNKSRINEGFHKAVTASLVLLIILKTVGSI